MSSYLRVPLAAAPSSVRRARDTVRAWLVEVGRSSAEYVAAQVVTELTTNAVVHGQGPIVLHLWCRRDGVRIGVSDGSTVVPRPLLDDPSAPQGRGLRVVERLSARWDADVHERGKVVWADVVASVGAPPEPDPLAAEGSTARWHLGWRAEGAPVRAPASDS